MKRNTKMELLELLKDVGAARAAADWLDEKDADDKKAPAKRLIQFQLPRKQGAPIAWADAEADEVIAGQTIRMFEADSGAPVEFEPGVTEARLQYAAANVGDRNGFIFMLQAKPDQAKTPKGGPRANCNLRCVEVSMGSVTLSVEPYDSEDEDEHLRGLRLVLASPTRLFFTIGSVIAARVLVWSDGRYQIDLGTVGRFNATKATH